MHVKNIKLRSQYIYLTPCPPEPRFVPYTADTLSSALWTFLRTLCTESGVYMAWRQSLGFRRSRCSSWLYSHPQACLLRIFFAIHKSRRALWQLPLPLLLSLSRLRTSGTARRHLQPIRSQLPTRSCSWCAKRSSCTPPRTVAVP